MKFFIFSSFLLFSKLCEFGQATELRWAVGEDGLQRRLVSNTTKYPDRLRNGQPWMTIGKGYVTNLDVIPIALSRSFYSPLAFTSALPNSAQCVQMQPKTTPDSTTWKFDFSVKEACGQSKAPFTTPQEMTWMVVDPGWYSFVEMNKTILVGTPITVKSGQSPISVPFTSFWHKAQIFANPPVVLAQVQTSDAYVSAVVTSVNAKSFSLVIKADPSSTTSYTVGWMALDPAVFPLPLGYLTAINASAKSPGLYELDSTLTFGRQCGASAVFTTPVGTEPLKPEFGAPVPVLTVQQGSVSYIRLDHCVCPSSKSPLTTAASIGAVIYDSVSCANILGGSVDLAPSDAAAHLPKSNTKKSSTLIWLIVFGVLAVIVVALGCYFLCSYSHRQDPVTATQPNYNDGDFFNPWVQSGGPPYGGQGGPPYGGQGGPPRPLRGP